jgi:murein DD-endopeptidase MepM/ murein hydrolase activator NlpD
MAIFLSLLSYQRAFAAANGFILKKVRTGDNVVTVLRQLQFSDRERERVLSEAPALQRLYLQLDVAYLVKQDASGTELRLYPAQNDWVYIIKKSAQGVSAKVSRVAFKTTVMRVDGVLKGSLMSNIFEKTQSNWVASRFMDAYLLDYNLNRGLSKGGKFWLTTEKKYDGPFFIRYGEVLQTSLEIRGNVVKKNFVRINTGNGGVFITESDFLKNRPYYAPVTYLRIASLFQPHRRHPITGKVKAHLGVDFELPEGTPIYAARTGVVARFGRNRAAGNFVVLLHGNGYETSYNHMRRVDPKIRRGLKLATGQQLGEVGCTGYCTKAHLHFAVKQKGRMVDPLKYLRPYPVFAENMLHAKVAQF